MPNPFVTKFDSECQNCGSEVEEGDEMFSDDGEFICNECARERNIICDCGKKKKSSFEKCYECFKESE